MDLSDFDTIAASDEGAWLSLQNPKTLTTLVDKEGKESRIRLAGIDSEIYKTGQRKAQNRRLSIPRGRRNQNMTAEELDAEALDLLVACTLEFENIQVDKKEMDATPANVRVVYTRFPWIREQVDQFIADRGNFLK